MATLDSHIPSQRGEPGQEPIPAIGYIRVSLAREEMISPELQRRAIEDWGARTGHKIIDWVEDLDKTGRNFKRRIMKVIERVEAGEARVIAVWKYSRFGRSRSGCATNLDRVERAGGQLVSATEHVDTATAEGRLQRGIIFEFNAYESDRAGMQWRETHALRRASGLPASGRKRLGYTWHPRKVYRPDGSVVLQEERYEPDPNAAPLVADLYQRYINGEGFLSLCMTINQIGVRTARGNQWSVSVLKRYMDSGFPAGYLNIHDPACRCDPYRWDCPAHSLVRHPTLHHPTIITDEVWEQYRHRRAVVAATPPRARAAVYPFAGTLRCGLCGAGVDRAKTRQETYRYRCRTRREKGPTACSGTSCSEAVIRAAAMGWLKELSEEIDVQASDAAAGAEGKAGVRAALLERDVKEDLEAQIARLDRAIGRQMRMYALLDEDDADGLLEDEHRKTLGALRDEKAVLRSRLDGLSEGSAGRAASRRAAVPVAQGLLAEWHTIPSARLNALIRTIVSRMELHPGNEVRIIPVWDVY